MSQPRVNRRKSRRERLILALLHQPNVERAAPAVGISSVTAWRITKTTGFQEEYRQARREAFSQSLGRLQQAAGAAASTLLKVMTVARLLQRVASGRPTASWVTRPAPWNWKTSRFAWHASSRSKVKERKRINDFAGDSRRKYR